MLLSEGGTIYERMARIMSEVDAIGKGSFNQTQNFRFRSVDDVMNSLHSIFARNGVFIMPEVLDWAYFEQTTAKGGIMFHHHVRVKYTFTAPDGTNISATGLGEAADAGDKSVNKCLAIALKYILTQGFLIPTEEDKDPDGSSVTYAKADRKRKVADSNPPGVQQNTVAEQAVYAEERVKEEKKKVLYDILKYFADMKKALGEREYYMVLGNSGYEKSNEIQDITIARRIYKMMGERLKEINALKEGAPVSK